MIDRIIETINCISLLEDRRLKEKDFCKIIENAFRKTNIEYKKELRLLIPLENLQKINRLAFLDGNYYGNVIADFVCDDIAIEIKCVDEVALKRVSFERQCNMYLNVPGINKVLLIILERSTAKPHILQFHRKQMPQKISNYEKIAERLIHFIPHLSVAEFAHNLKRKEYERCHLC